MHDTDSARTEDIELILSMATMLVSGEDEAQAGLGKFQEQWANDKLDLQGLKAFMARLCQEKVIAKDILKDITALIDEVLAREFKHSAFGQIFEYCRQAGTPRDLELIDMLAGAPA